MSSLCFVGESLFIISCLGKRGMGVLDEKKNRVTKGEKIGYREQLVLYDLYVVIFSIYSYVYFILSLLFVLSSHRQLCRLILIALDSS